MPRSRENLLARALGRNRAIRHSAGLLRRGSSVECPACGARFSAFFTSLDNQCWSCGTLPRHRQIALLLRERRDALLRPGMRVLHVAPEASVRQLLPPDVVYVAGDLAPRRGVVKVDVTEIEFPDAHFDAVICNHVLDQVPDDRAAMAEIRRVTAAVGWAILMAPILRERTDEDPSVTDPAERRRRWGQGEKIRQYGWDYVDRLTAAGFEVEVVPNPPPEQVARHSLLNRQGFVEPLFLARAR